MRKKIFIVLFVILIFIINIIIFKEKSSIVSTSNNDVYVDKIEIKFASHSNKDNLVPYNLINFDKNEIAKVYYKKEYRGYQFIVCLDNNNTLNIVYIEDDKYYSICQIPDWSIEGQYYYENTKGNGITEFENILGHSGIKIELQSGAASRYIIYLIINNDTPSILLSDSLSGEFSEFDIDGNGQKELLAYDGYMYIKINDNLYRATYDYDKSKIKQVLFDENLGHYIVYFNDGTKKEYKYDSKQKCLTEF